MTTNIQAEIIAISSLTAVVCAIPGAFLVLRGDAVLPDTSSRSSVLGFALVFAFVYNAPSPLLVFAGVLAALVGILTTSVLTNKTKIQKEHSGILVSGFLLSFGILIINYASNYNYTDIEAVLLGELAVVPFDRMVIFGRDLGSQALYSLGGVLMFNMLCVFIFYKGLKSSCIDRDYALSVRIKMSYIDILVPLMVALSLASAFQIAGAFMTTAFILGPAATARFYTKRLSTLMMTSVAVSLASCLTGFSAAYNFDISISASIVSVIGLLFLFSFLFAPEYGVFARMGAEKEMKKNLQTNILLVHLLQDDASPSGAARISDFLNWNKKKVAQVVEEAKSLGFITVDDLNIKLTNEGIEKAKKMLYI